MRFPAFFLFLSCFAACSESPRSDSIATESRQIPPRSQLCKTPPAGLRITPDSIAGFPTRANISTLDQLCPSDSLDDYGIGGTTAKARVYYFPGGKIFAVQSDHEALLEMNEPADLWGAEGDSLRLADGQLIPHTIGELRKRYPNGYITADKGDDSDGVLAHICQFPRVIFVLGYDVPTPADTGTWAFPVRAVPDTANIWRVELWPEPGWQRIKALCARHS